MNTRIRLSASPTALAGLLLVLAGPAFADHHTGSTTPHREVNVGEPTTTVDGTARPVLTVDGTASADGTETVDGTARPTLTVDGTALDVAPTTTVDGTAHSVERATTVVPASIETVDGTAFRHSFAQPGETVDGTARAGGDCWRVDTVDGTASIIDTPSGGDCNQDRPEAQ